MQETSKESSKAVEQSESKDQGVYNAEVLNSTNFQKFIQSKKQLLMQQIRARHNRSNMKLKHSEAGEGRDLTGSV